MTNKFIPLSVPNLKGNEKKYVNQALDSEWVSTGGSFITDFENEMAKYLGAKQAVACQSGTAGIHLALEILGVNEAHEVIVPTLTFIAAVNPVKYCKAEPVFMDCNESFCMDPLKLEQFIKESCEFDGKILTNKLSKKVIKGIVVVHVFGNLADMDSIMRIAQAYNLFVIEDATEALGSYYTTGVYSGKHAGTIGDFGVYSFNGNKIITTGGGGMLVANKEAYLAKAKYLSTQAKDDEFAYVHHEVGYNYRMTNLQAALGLAQLEQLDDFIKTKQDNYAHYLEKIEKIEGVKLATFSDAARSNKWFYALIVQPEIKDALMKYFGEHQVQVRPIWGLIHEQKPYANCQVYKIEMAKHLFDTVINIPCSTNLTFEDIDYVVGVLTEMIEGR